MKVIIDKSKAQAVLVVEDDSFRIEWFERQFAGIPFLFITKDVDEAITLIRLIKFDMIFLDHDLGDFEEVLDAQFAGQPEPTGLDVAKEIPGTVNQETECIVHSMNPTGAANIIKAHPHNTTHIPFHLLYKIIEVI